MTDDEPPLFVTTMEEFSTDFGATTVDSEPVLVHSLQGEGGQVVVGVCSAEIHEGECHLAVGIDEPATAHTAELRLGEVAPNNDPRLTGVAIDHHTQESLGVAEGDVVWVTGDRQTACVVSDAESADTGLDILRCNAAQRANAGASLGETVTLSPALTVDADSVELAVPGRLRGGDDSRDVLVEQLSDHPVQEGDLLELSAELFVANTARNQRTPDIRTSDESVIAEVDSVSPNVAEGEVAVITDETDVRVAIEDQGNRESSPRVEPVDGNEAGHSDGDEETETDQQANPVDAQESDRSTTVHRPAARVPGLVEPALPESVSYNELNLGERIDGGGFAEIRAAEVESSPDTTLAIKRLSDDGTITKRKIERFVTEAELWAQCDDHPHVVSVVDWGKVPQPWIAMERATGGDLRERLDEDDGGLPIEEGLWIATVLAEALADVHHLGVRHLDLGARNVLFAPTPDDAWMIPKIGDWGVAKAQRSGDGDPNALNPAYAAPEQFESDRELDHRTDIYQFGAVVYELLTGQVPTATGASGESVVERSLPTPPSELRPELPSAVDEVVQTALAPGPDDRHRRAIYMADALDRLVEE